MSLETTIKFMIIIACGSMYGLAAWLFWISSLGGLLTGLAALIIAMKWTYEGIKVWRNI